MDVKTVIDALIVTVLLLLLLARGKDVATKRLHAAIRL